MHAPPHDTTKWSTNHPAYLYDAGNYYPMTCTGYILDTAADAQLTVLSDRTHGASSQGVGEFEVMYHRRTLSEDGRGPLDLDDRDNLQNIRSFLAFTDSATSTNWRHHQQYVLNFPPSIFYSTSSYTNAARNYSALTQPFPQNVHLLSLIQVNSSFTGILVRLAHIYAVGEDPVLSQPATIQLSDYINFASIASMDERTLTGLHASAANHMLCHNPFCIWIGLALYSA
jgi:hypothetical protein